MKVTLEGKNEPRILEESKTQARKNEKAGRKNGIGQQDRVRLSKEVQQFRETGLPVPGTEQAHLERLEKVRSMIQEGTYAPDNRSVADKMIRQAVNDSH